MLLEFVGSVLADLLGGAARGRSAHVMLRRLAAERPGLPAFASEPAVPTSTHAWDDLPALRDVAPDLATPGLFAVLLTEAGLELWSSRIRCVGTLAWDMVQSAATGESFPVRLTSGYPVESVVIRLREHRDPLLLPLVAASPDIDTRDGIWRSVFVREIARRSAAEDR